ncbi:MAG: PAS domain-containing protein [Anaerolineales bacterium]|nr:PAS domain-containing protein [Anaerolineales bacterium]
MNRARRMLFLLSLKDEPEKARHATLLRMASIAIFFVALMGILLNLFLGNDAERSVNSVLIGIGLLQIPVQFLVRSGRVRFASGFLLFMLWVALTWIASKVDGVNDVAVVAYFLLLLAAGYLLGWRVVTLLTTWTILAVWVLAAFEAAGLIQQFQGNPIRIAVDLTVIFVIASLEIYFVLNELTRSLNSARTELEERQRVEVILRDEQEKLNLALHAAKMETWNWNIETGSISWSEGTEAMFGLAKGQFDGKYDTYLSLVHPDDVSKVQKAIREALMEREYDYVIEHRLIWPDGGVHWVEGRGKVYWNEKGKPIRMAGTVVDVTKRKDDELERERLIRELAAKNTELEQFTYTVSHDLKAPIITIKGFLGFLGEDARAGRPDRLERDITRINEAVDKMHRLLNELLELSRIGRMMNSPVIIPFRALVDEALTLVTGRLQTTPVQIKVADSFPNVNGDRRRLLEVTQNLLDNAIKFSADRPSPLVEIGWSGYENAMPIFFVCDNGIGIAHEHHERIFDLFNKLDPVAEGTGVGLALVKRIIEFHGGRIWVQSEAGKGTTFFFTLPSESTKPG